MNQVYPEFISGYYAFKLKDANCFPTYLLNDNVKSTTSATNWWRIIEMKESNSSKFVQLVLDPLKDFSHPLSLFGAKLEIV